MRGRLLTIGLGFFNSCVVDIGLGDIRHKTSWSFGVGVRFLPFERSGRDYGGFLPLRVIKMGDKLPLGLFLTKPSRSLQKMPDKKRIYHPHEKLYNNIHSLHIFRCSMHWIQQFKILPNTIFKTIY